MKNSAIAAVTILSLGGLAAGFFALDTHARNAALEQVRREARARKPLRSTTPAPLSASPPAMSGSPAPAPAPDAAPVQSSPAAQPLVRAAPAAQRPPAAAPVTEPMARTALLTVGQDDNSTQIWASAINDDSIAPNLRKDLIEDLNQDGFADPKNLTAADLPMIDSRIALIEQLGPDAMDDVNYAAFQEAYRDLLAMRARVAGR